MHTLKSALMASIMVVGFGHQTLQANDSSVLDFEYLEFGESEIRSNHELPFAIQKPEGFKVTSIHSYQAVFNEHPFNVSTAAFIKDDIIIAVHAEGVTDDSGFLDYSYKEPTQLGDTLFYSSHRCATLTSSDIDGAADLSFYRQNGYDFHPHIYLKQFFLHAPSGNAEYVLTFGQKVKDCSEQTITPEFLEHLNHNLSSLVQLTNLK